MVNGVILLEFPITDCSFSFHLAGPGGCEGYYLHCIDGSSISTNVLYCVPQELNKKDLH